MLLACSNLGSLERAGVVIQEMKTRGYELTDVCYTLLIKTFAEACAGGAGGPGRGGGGGNIDKTTRYFPDSVEGRNAFKKAFYKVCGITC